MSERLDHARPLWAVDLVGPLADGREAVVVRIHHAMADGISCVRFLEAVLFDPPAEAGPARGSRGLGCRYGRPLAGPRPAPPSGRARARARASLALLGARSPDRRPPGARLRHRTAGRAEADRRRATLANNRQRRPARGRRRRPARVAAVCGRAGCGRAAGAGAGEPPSPRCRPGRTRQSRFVPERRPAARRARPGGPARRDQRRDQAQKQLGDAEELYDFFHALGPV